jgi:ankyrin repeat protein
VRAGRWADAEAALGRRADANLWVQRPRTITGLKTSAPVLFWALEAGESALVRALLAENASLQVRLPAVGSDRATHGETVLDWVSREADFLALLGAGLAWYQAGGAVTRDMAGHVAAAHGWVRGLIWLARHGALMDVRNGQGQTLLHAAVRQAVPPRLRSGVRTTLEALVRAGTPLEAIDHQGDTALVVAARHTPELVPTLVRLGATLSGPSGAVVRAALHAHPNLAQQVESALACRRLQMDARVAPPVAPAIEA